MNVDLDVLVVGGGPVGLFAAHELCRHGVSPKRIKIIDKRPKQKLWCKAVGIQSRTQEIIYASSQSLHHELQTVALKLQTGSFYQYPPNSSDDGVTFKDNELILTSNFNVLQSQFNYMANTEQYNMENLIAKQLNDKYNIKLERGIELISFTDKGGYVEVTLRPYRGKNVSDDEFKESEYETLRVKYLIGCDGAHSFVRQKLNLPFEGEVYHEKYISFHGEINDNGVLSLQDAGVINGINGILTLIPLKDGTWYLVGDLDDKQLAEINKRHNGEMKQPTEEDIEWMMRERGMNGCSIKSTKWLSSFTLSSKQINQYSKGRVYLAGDACHIHSPLGGQGMNMGMQDAANLSWKLAMVINKKAGASLLTSYNMERFSVDNDVLKMVDSVHKGALVRSPVGLAINKTLQKFMGSYLRFMIDAQIQSVGQITYSYKNNSDISFEYWKPPSIIPYLLYRRQQNMTRLFRHRLHAGDRCPDFVIPSDIMSSNDKKYANRNLYELFRDPTDKPFVILIFEGNEDPFWRVPFTDYKDINEFKHKIEASQIGEYCKVILIPSIYQKLNELFGVYQQCLFLIRPDQYIGLRSQPLSMNTLRYYLSQKMHINDVRVEDDDMERCKDIERIDPVPKMLIIGYLVTIGCVIGNRFLPQQYKPSNFINSLLFNAFS